MAYRDHVAFIEAANADHVEWIGRECLDTIGVIKSVLPILLDLPAKLHWRSPSGDLAGPRLGEIIKLAEALHDGFDKAGSAPVDYVDALR